MSSHGLLYDKFWGKMDEWTQSRPLTPKELEEGRLRRDKQEDSGLSLLGVENNWTMLRKNPHLITISKKDAQQIYYLFMGTQLTTDVVDQDARAFLQGALMAAIDGSYLIGFVEIIFKNAYLKLPPAEVEDFIKLMKSLTRQFLKFMYKHMKAKVEGEVPPLYTMVLGVIVFHCRSHFDMIAHRDQVSE